MTDPALTSQQLDLYDTQSGWWSPEHGEVEIPDGWEFLPAGEPFVTRHVTTAGTFWLAWRPRSRGRGHRRRMGLWAPAEAIRTARAAEENTAATRAVSRAASTRQRERGEDRYRSELRDAIVAYLDFAQQHAELAHEIADAAATRASQVGSGRVGRTATLSLPEKAELAARAHIRHHHTDYEDQLADAVPDGSDPVAEAGDYREARTHARAAVDLFLASHRTPR